jgi:hypothetical protein
MSPQLTVHNAQISTATVQIKTLTITGKQVTLAVFRQLIEEPLIAEDGTLNDVPWGTVNYHPDKCAGRPEHWHVVWQKGGELRRSQVRTQYETPNVFWSESLERHYAACVHHWLSTGETRYWQGGIFKLFSGELEHTGIVGGKIDSYYSRKEWVRRAHDVVFADETTGVKVGLDIPEEVKAAVLALSAQVGVREDWEQAKKRADRTKQELEEAKQDLDAARNEPFASSTEGHADSCTCGPCCRLDPQKAERLVGMAERDLESAEERVRAKAPESPAAQEAADAFRAALAELGDRYATGPLDKLWAEYRDDLDAEAARRQPHIDARKAIADLPQLFIAV